MNNESTFDLPFKLGATGGPVLLALAAATNAIQGDFSMLSQVFFLGFLACLGLLFVSFVRLIWKD